MRDGSNNFSWSLTSIAMWTCRKRDYNVIFVSSKRFIQRTQDRKIGTVSESRDKLEKLLAGVNFPPYHHILYYGDSNVRVFYCHCKWLTRRQHKNHFNQQLRYTYFHASNQINYILLDHNCKYWEANAYWSG